MTGEALNSTDPEPDPITKQIEQRFVSPGMPPRGYTAEVAIRDAEVEATFVEDTMGAGDPVATISITGIENESDPAQMEIDAHNPSHVDPSFLRIAAPLAMQHAAVKVVEINPSNTALSDGTLKSAGILPQNNGNHILDFRTPAS